VFSRIATPTDMHCVVVVGRDSLSVHVDVTFKYIIYRWKS